MSEKVFVSAESLLRDSMELAIRIVRSGIPTDHVAIRTSTHTGIDRRDDTVRVHAIDYLISRLAFEEWRAAAQLMRAAARSPSSQRSGNHMTPSRGSGCSGLSLAFTGGRGHAAGAPRDSGDRLGHAVLAALVLPLLGRGAYPAPLLTLIRATASMVAR